MHSPLVYLGGKSRLAKRIIPLFPKHACYCEPFCGAAWVLFTKEPSRCEVINDMDGELVTFWRVIQNHLEEFLRYYRWAVVSRRIFELEGKKDRTTLTDVQRAVRYYYLQRLGFGGKTIGRTFGTSTQGAPRLNLVSMEDVLLEVHGRLTQVVIENLDACECIRRYDRSTTLFYCDPPYWGTAGYSTPFGPENYQALRAALDRIHGRFILSLNDVAAVRKLFRGYHFKRVSTSYSVGNPRAGARREKRVSEVLIHNL